MDKLNVTEAENNKMIGINKAIHNANNNIESWADMATEILDLYLSDNDQSFMTEDLRVWAEENGFPLPPSKRAWGGVIRKAHKNGKIKFHGYGKTKNPLAHRTPAALWIKENHNG